ncbi:hypothetical protein NBRC116494_11220 [Aurantivibrio plasticivorans]
MLKIYGFPLSNYYNMVKVALLEKGLEFEEVLVKPSQEADFLAKSPMGKVPFIETDQGFISETSVIFEYLEELGQGTALYPADNYQRAKVRELIKEIELYIELPARTLYPEVFFGGSVSQEVKDSAKAKLVKGVRCLERNGAFDPFVAGDSLTYADIMFMYSVNLASVCSRKALGFSLLGDFPKAKSLADLLSQRDSAKAIAASQKS